MWVFDHVLSATLALGIVIAGSSGFVFVPGDSPAICQGCGILLPICCSGWLGLAFFLSRLFSRLGDLCLTSGPGQHDLVRSFWIEAPVRPFRPPAWDLSAVLQFLNSSGFAPFHRVSSPFGEEGPVFHGLRHCQTGWWGAGCLWDGFFCSSRRLSLFCAGVWHQDGVLFQFPSSLFLGGFLVGFCGWAGQ